MLIVFASSICSKFSCSVLDKTFYNVESFCAKINDKCSVMTESKWKSFKRDLNGSYHFLLFTFRAMKIPSNSIELNVFSLTFTFYRHVHPFIFMQCSLFVKKHNVMHRLHSSLVVKSQKVFPCLTSYGTLSARLVLLMGKQDLSVSLKKSEIKRNFWRMLVLSYDK